MIEVSAADFEGLVAQALDFIPAELAAVFDNVVVVVADDPPANEPDLLGLYTGIPLTERDSSYAGALPDQITIFRLPTLEMWLPDQITIFRIPTLEMCDSIEEVIDEVQITVVHEIAHHFGIDDERLHELGYE
ncbi:MAG: metallopeptidase family protein [Actinobacteria bacterium]|nr:metallopeptidase family protein [Actinomycetota bacterium]